MTQETQPFAVDAAAPRRGLHIGLWVAQALLAIGFAMAGLMKLTTPYQQLVSSQAWAQSMPEALLRFIGLSEVAGALGVLLPAATRIRPILTPIAAVGLLIIMVLASGVHLMHGEPPIANLVLGGLAAFVAWGRFTLQSPRSNAQRVLDDSDDTMAVDGSCAGAQRLGSDGRPNRL